MSPGPLAPSGDQHEIRAAGYRAVVTGSGAALRVLQHDGRDLVDGFEEHDLASGGRGQLLVPWCNRVADGRWSFEGRDLQLPLTEPARHHASHGLVRWTSWSVVERTAESVVMGYRLAAQTGYPWTLDLTTRYALGPDGLVVTQAATNRGPTRAPYASGAHPYLSAGAGPVDGWEVAVPAATRLLVDDRLLPVGTEPVAGTPHDLRRGRVLGDLALDDAVTDLVREPDGRAWVRVRGEHDVALWVDERHGWLQLFTGAGETARRSLAVEPMTAPANSLRSGEGLVVLEPGERTEASWGIVAGDDLRSA